MEIIGFSGMYDNFISEYLDTQLQQDFEESAIFDKIKDFDCMQNLWELLDYQKFYTDFSKSLASEYMEELKLNQNIKNLIKNYDFKELYSPKYYNYETDRIFINIKVSKKQWKKMFEFLENHIEEFDKILKNHFTSYDGFISYHSNKASEWLELKNIPFKEIYEIKESFLIYSYYLISENITEEEYIDKLREIEAEKCYDFFYSEYFNSDKFYELLRNEIIEKNIISNINSLKNETTYELLNKLQFVNESGYLDKRQKEFQFVY